MKHKGWFRLCCLLGGAVLALQVLSACQEKIEPDATAEGPVGSYQPLQKKAVSVQQITDWYEAVGTIRPRTETRIQAQVAAQVLAVKVKSGDRVEKGSVLVTLDNRRLLSRLHQAKESRMAAQAGEQQARQAVVAAEAAYTEARSAFERTQKYFQSQAATKQDLEKAKSAYLQAEAGVRRSKQALEGANAMIRQARQVVKEAEIALDYTTIRAPGDGEVLKRMIQPGDLALPGKPLFILRTSGLLRMEASVREGLIDSVKPGMAFEVDITTLGHRSKAVVEEIVPYADPQTRTFLVKASLPHIEGLYPGMFGKLLIPVQVNRAVMIPREAVRQVGQLELVWVEHQGRWMNRYIKTGRRIDDQVEVLSGLSGKETIGWGGSTQ